MASNKIYQRCYFIIGSAAVIFGILNYGDYFLVFGKGVENDLDLLPGDLTFNLPSAKFYEINIFFACLLWGGIHLVVGQFLNQQKKLGGALNLLVPLNIALSIFTIIFLAFHATSTIDFRIDAYARMILDPVFNRLQQEFEHINIHLSVSAYLTVLTTISGYLLSTLTILVLLTRQIRRNVHPTID